MRPYTGVKSVADVLEALELIDRYDTAKTSHAYTLTGGSVTSTVDGLGEADYYGRYAEAIEAAFPGRWIGKVVAQALPRAEVQRFKDYGIQIYHPNYEVCGRPPVRADLAGQAALRRAGGVAPAHLRRRRGLRPAPGHPQLRRRGRDGTPLRLRHGRRGDRLDARGARVLHEPRGHASLHNLVPGAGHAARHDNPDGAPLEYHIRLLGTYRETLERFGLVPPPGLRSRRRRERGLLGQRLHGYPRTPRQRCSARGARMSTLAAIAAKVERGGRIDAAEAALLWREADDEELKRLAQVVRARFHEPGRATYMVMRIINYTNVCVARCDYCAFYVLPNQAGGYVLSREQVFAKIDELLELGGDLVGFNGGFNPRPAAELLRRALRGGA